MKDRAPSKGANFKPAWLTEAIATLARYNTDPFTINFMHKHDLKLLPTQAAMHQSIVAHINDPKKPLTFNDLVEYLDELKMWGKQHVFFYLLKKNEREYLEKLRNPAYIKTCLGEHKLKNRHNRNICKWESKKPLLAEVRHVTDDEGRYVQLSYKWVETRYYLQLINNMLVQHQERSVSFFIVNLEDGSAQLRIQSLPTRPIRRIAAELAVYKQEVGKLIDLDRFTPVSLEPIMREFLTKRILKISVWSVRRAKPGGGRIEVSKVSPTFVEKIFQLPFKRLIPHELELFWRCQQDAHGNKRLFFKMTSRNDGILFNAITDQSKVDFILHILQAAGRSFMRIPPLLEPPDQVGRDGLRGMLIKSVEGKKHKTLTKAAAEVTVVSAAGLVLLIWNIILRWLVPEIFQEVTGVPFIGLELLLVLVIIIGFYDGRSIKNWMQKIPPKYIHMVIKLILGQSPLIEITRKKYEKWKKQRGVNGNNLQPHKNHKNCCSRILQRLTSRKAGTRS